MIEEKGWIYEPQQFRDKTGKKIIPDVLTRKGNLIELKPNTPTGRAQGKRQMARYKAATGRKGKVIYYDVKKSASATY